jgi:hypothetical protein
MDARINSGHDEMGLKGIRHFFRVIWADPDASGKPRGFMRARLALLAVFAAGLGTSACQAPLATLERTIAGNPAKPYLGMTKDEVVACAGKPSGSYANATGETLVYHYTGPGPTPSAEKEKAKADAPKGPLGQPKADKNWACSASLNFENGRFTRATFAPREVVSPYATKKDAKTGEKKAVEAPEPCTFSLPNCAKR